MRNQDDLDAWRSFLKEVKPLRKSSDLSEKASEKKFIRKKTREEGEFIKALDLHGLTLAEAYYLLEAYLKTAQQLKIRKVLIITGKGSESREDPNTRTLFEKVPRWCTEGPLKAYVKKIEPLSSPSQKPQGAYSVQLR